MELITVSPEAINEWNKWFSARNQCVDDCHVKYMNKFGHHVDEEEDESSEDK